MNRVPKTKRQDLWWDWSWNPITGCMNRCDYCYAHTLARRFPAIHGHPDFKTPRFHPERMTEKDLRQPKDGQRVFVVSMGDVFGTGVKRDWVRQVIKAIQKRPLVHFIFLSKFPVQYGHYDWPRNAWLGTTLDTYHCQLAKAEAMRQLQAPNVIWFNAAPALSVPHEYLHTVLVPDWLVSEPRHGSTAFRLQLGEQNVIAWHRWAHERQVPMWAKGMRYWPPDYGKQPRQLPTLQGEFARA